MPERREEVARHGVAPGRRDDIDELFHPRAVALIGSVRREADPDKLRRANDGRWGTTWYLVNARGGRVGEIPVYEHVTDIPGEVTLAVVNVGTSDVLQAMEECGKHGVRHVLIFTAGFSEVGPEGAALEREVGEAARRYGIRVFGPNTNTNAFEALQEPPRLRGGRIGLITQSGHQGRPLVQGAEFGVAFSRWVPTGNELDYEAADFIEYFAYDAETAVIAGYFEGFRDPPKLRRALEAANEQHKAVVALKIGSTRAGARMASSHTGHLAGSDAVVDGLFRQYGVVRVRDLDELLETAALFAKLPAGTGARCALYSISGGSGALMAEVAESHGVEVPTLSASTQQALREIIPGYLTVVNPVDNGAQFLLAAPVDQRRRVFELLAADPAVDVIVVGLTGALGRLTDRFAEDIVAFADDLSKPIVVTWNSFKTDQPGFRTLVDAGMPMFRSFRNCFAALHALGRYKEATRTFRHRRRPATRMPSRLAEVLDCASSDGAFLGSAETRELLSAFGIPLVEEALARHGAEAGRLAKQIGFPLAMKVSSRSFPHKSDFGLVELGISSAAAAERAYAALLQRAAMADPKAVVEGVVLQREVRGGTEMIVGMSRDPILGQAILVGTGGILAELLADVSVRPLPIDRRDATEMVGSLRGAALLQGFRGRPPGDVRSLVEVILAVAALAGACGERLEELDLNPVAVMPEGAVVLDALAVVGKPVVAGRQ
ncbi:MAG: acetate--CoA ligase family protein [Acidimicrobiales bacterium]